MSHFSSQHFINKYKKDKELRNSHGSYSNLPKIGGCQSNTIGYFLKAIIETLVELISLPYFSKLLIFIKLVVLYIYSNIIFLFYH